MGKQKKTAKATSAPRAPISRANKQSSPITIGGGSVSIDFDHDKYVYTGNRFSKANDEIDTVWVYDSDNSLKWDLHDFVFGKNCAVTVHTKVASSVRDIVIRNTPQGPLTIEFDVGEFPLTAASTRRHFHANRKVVDAIEVLDNGDNSKATFSIPSAGKCLIQIVNLH